MRRIAVVTLVWGLVGCGDGRFRQGASVLLVSPQGAENVSVTRMERYDSLPVPVGTEARVVSDPEKVVIKPDRPVRVHVMSGPLSGVVGTVRANELREP